MGEKYPGEAVMETYNKLPSYEGAGGGMSQSENRHANSRGKVIYDTGPPKGTTDGRDLGKNAKNCIGDYSEINSDPISPSSHSHSSNQKKSY